MLKRLILLGNFMALAGSLFAKSAETDSVKYGWQKEIVGTFNLTQASFQNWAAGGENTLAWHVNLATTFTQDQENFNWSNTGKFILGFTKIEGSEARKSADEINLETVFTPKLARKLNPFIAATAKTQFISGFEYSDTSKVKISEFLDPAYFSQSAGISYKPNKIIKTRLGLSIKETVTDIFPQESEVEAGLTSVTDFKKTFQENIIFSSKLDLFSNLKSVKQVDILWENDLNLKVSKYIVVTLEVDLLYDKDITSDHQIRQTMAIGLTYSFL